MRIKALTVWQPWASLIAHGVKVFETRSWATKWRGPLAIHAAGRWGRDIDMLVQRPPYPALLAGLELRAETLPLGCVVCVVDLIDVIPARDVLVRISDGERRLGDFRPGRFAWELGNVRLLKEPVYAKGTQGLWWWDVPDGLGKRLGLKAVV